MEVNLLELFDKDVKPALFKELKHDNAEDDQVINQHLTIVHASILGGLITKSKNDNGSRAIKNLIEKGNHTGSIIEDIPEIFESEEKLSDIKKLGNSLLTFIFEDKTDKAFEQIQHFLSEKYRVTTDDLIDINRIVAPFSMALIGRLVHKENTTEEQLSALLQSHESIIHQEFPGLAIVLGMQAPSKSVGSSKSMSSSKPEASKETIQSKETHRPKPAMEEPNHTTNGEEELIDVKFFTRTLLPWIAILVTAGASLILLNRFQTDPVVKGQDNPFNFIQSDSLIFSGENTYILPGNVQLKAGKNTSLDTLLRQLEKSTGTKDTIRYTNTQIHFEDSSAILTPSANQDLVNILSIMKSYSDLNMNIDIYYDSTFLVHHPGISERQVTNLREYFIVFGLDNSRITIKKGLLPKKVPSKPQKAKTDLPDSNPTQGMDSTAQKKEPSIPFREERVDVLFYFKTPPADDSINIQ